MSSESLPISAERFAKALGDLPISSLHAKVSELQNSIAHLEESNKHLEEYVIAEDDKDCYEALMENKQVIKRMEERIELVKREITEVRGLPLQPPGEKAANVTTAAAETRNGDVEMASAGADTGTVAQAGTAAETNGSVQALRNGGSVVAEEEGVFL